MKNEEITILLVDDEPDILEIIGFNLSREGFQVLTAENGEEALKIASRRKPQLIILDVMMPKMDGIETCERLRQMSELDKTLISFLTARGEDYSQVAGLGAGADDYITKPVRPKVLVSKVKSLLRRLHASDAEQEVIKLKDLIINSEEHRVYKGDEEFNLPRKEFKLMALLASKPDKVFTREVIMDTIWGNEVIVGDRTIDVHIRKLREKFGDHRFETIRGVGYKFVE